MTEKTPPEQNLISDAFTSAVMRRIDYFVSQGEVEPLSPEQLSIVEKGVSACKPKVHAIDIRGVLPLHFVRLYYVFLMGRDKRSLKQTIAHDVRQRTKPIAHVIFWIFAIWPFYIVAYFIYWILNHLPLLYQG